MERLGDETISRHPEEMYFILTWWLWSLSTWPDIKGWTFMLYLLCSHEVMLTCVANRIKRKHWFWLEGRAGVTHADGLMPYCESRLVEVGYESLPVSSRGEEGEVRSNEGRRSCVTYQKDWKRRWIHNLCTVHTHFFMCALHSHFSLRWNIFTILIYALKIHSLYMSLL